MERFDAIVIGTGGVGSATLHQLAQRGLRVLGLDQFPQVHARGSSHGQSRIIRQAYFEHPDYVPLLLQAYSLWDRVERESDRKLFHQVGLLEVGPPDGMLIQGVMQSVTQHNLPIEQLSVAEAGRRFPFSIPDGMQVVFEPTAGYLLVEQCVQTHLDLAERAGATWRQQRVRGWSSTSTHVTVETESETFEADQLAVCGGAWSASLLGDLGVPLRVVPKHQYWFSTTDEMASSMPTYFFETAAGYFYGFPVIDDRGLKVARHGDGDAVDEPIELEGLVDPEDELTVRRFLSDCLPFCSDSLQMQQACMYTSSPDEHFLVDRHPQHDRVVFAAGLSGHGFKFSPVLGQALVELIVDGRTGLEIDFLGLGRFST